MSHPYEAHRADKVEHDRVKRIAGGDYVAKRARGGRAQADEDSNSSVGRSIQGAKTDRETTARTGSGTVKRLDKFARGGRAGKGKTNVNVIVGAHPAQPAMSAAGPMPLPPGAPPLPPGPVAPPMGGPAGPGPIPPIPPRSMGGRAKFAKGGAVTHDKGLSKAKREGMRNGTQVDHRPGKGDLGDIRTTEPITYARGGAVPHWLTGGAGSGVGRLEKAEEYGKRK